MKPTIDELLTDDSFVDYCTNPASVHKNKWDEFIAAHPDQLNVVQEAKSLLQMLNPRLQQEEINSELHKLYQALDDRKAAPANGAPVSNIFYVNEEGRLRGNRLQKIIIVLVCMVVAAILFYVFWPPSTT